MESFDRFPPIYSLHPTIPSSVPSDFRYTWPIQAITERLGRQPNSSYRSANIGPLPLVAKFVKKSTILDIIWNSKTNLVVE
jgi:hypothetical protein